MRFAVRADSLTRASVYTVDVVRARFAQSIDFTPLADRYRSDGPFELDASASSGLPVAFSSDTASICSVFDATVNPLARGECVIRAEQPGDDDHEAATPVVRNFAVNEDVDLAVSLDSGQAGVRPLERVHYVLDVTNAAPGDAAQASLRLDPDSGLGNLSWSCIVVGGGSCPAPSGIGPMDLQLPLPSAAALRFDVDADVVGAAGTTAVLSASIVAISDFTIERDPSSNAALLADPILADAVFADGFE